MPKTINQFMWGFQHLFRWCVEHETKRVLNEIGMPTTEAKVVLVGVANQENAIHPICVEPETGPLLSEHLATVNDRAQELYRADPESETLISHPRARTLYRLRLFRSSRANAIAEAIDKSGAFGNLSFFVSQSSPINGYDVHTCIGIPKDVIGGLPAFKEDTVERYHAGKSLQHEVIQECLHRADKVIYLPDLGDSLMILGRHEDIIASATEKFMNGTTWCTVRMPADLFSRLNTIASLTYERDGARGHLTITTQDNLEKWLTVRFKEPVRLSEPRTMRKVLQLCDVTTSVLADESRAYGLGASKTAPDVIEISVTGHAKWEASVNGETFVRVAYGKATIPNQPINFEELEDIAERTIGDANTKRIWEIIQAAQQAGQGATIVVSKDPATETLRLKGEGMPIEPDHLSPKEIVRLGSVDGAVIIGPDGRCHAFGVILDGVANEMGDRARGARFNSSVRYQNMETASSMIVVISDDGMVDLLPKLMPRVYRKDIAASVDAFCKCCDSEPVDSEEFARLYERVELSKFYLNDEQCRRVNKKHDQEMDRRLASGGAKITGRDLKPDPRMNESYFWEAQSDLSQ